MTGYSVEGYYRLIVERLPELRSISERVRREDGDDLYPMLWNLLGPILINVGGHWRGAAP